MAGVGQWRWYEGGCGGSGQRYGGVGVVVEVRVRVGVVVSSCFRRSAPTPRMLRRAAMGEIRISKMVRKSWCEVVGRERRH